MTEFLNNILTRLFSELEKAVQKLSDYSKISKQEFLENYEKIDTAKYNFIVAIEAIIDICNHLIAERKLGYPQDYADVMRIIGKEVSFPEGFIDKLVQMAKFRNMLVHMYWEIEEEQLYKFITENLDGFEIFESFIRSYLKKF